MLLGTEFLYFCQKMKCKLYEGVDYLSFGNSFNLALFFTAVIGWFYFTTFWDLAFKHLEMYSFRERNKQKHNCWNSEELCFSSVTAQTICLVLQRTSFLHRYPGVAALDNAFIFLFLFACLHLSTFFSSLSPLPFSSFPCFHFFLPLFQVSCLLFFI